jgi:hypothetical protein
LSSFGRREDPLRFFHFSPSSLLLVGADRALTDAQGADRALTDAQGADRALTDAQGADRALTDAQGEVKVDPWFA